MPPGRGLQCFGFVILSFSPVQNSRSYIFVSLGLLTAFGPYVTDLYLPALPGQAAYFGTSAPMVQLGLTASMLGLAFGQLAIGPLSDRFGRKAPLMASLPVFTAVTVLSVYSPSIEAFVALRFVQGAAGAAGIVLSRSIAADLFSGRELVSAMGTIGAVQGVAPVTAPVIGALLVSVTDWRGVFWVLAGLGLEIPVAGLVKDDRHRTRGIIYKDLELPIDTHSEAFKLITRIQDEVHRFAIEYHRSLRSKAQTRSVLEDIPGIGEKRRRQIMMHFAGADELMKATEEEIAAVPGMNALAAKNVYEFLHK